MKKRAYSSMPHGAPLSSDHGAGSFGGESQPDMLLEGLKSIRKKKEEELGIRQKKRRSS